MRVSHEVERDQVALLAARRGDRDEAAVMDALNGLLAAARSQENMIPVMIDAARHEATLGEMCNVLRQEWGEYTEPARI